MMPEARQAAKWSGDRLPNGLPTAVMGAPGCGASVAGGEAPCGPLLQHSWYLSRTGWPVPEMLQGWWGGGCLRWGYGGRMWVHAKLRTL